MHGYILTYFRFHGCHLFRLYKGTCFCVTPLSASEVKILLDWITHADKDQGLLGGQTSKGMYALTVPSWTGHQ